MKGYPKNIGIRGAFSKNLRYHRHRLGLTQAELAEKTGTTPAHIGHLERGDRVPSLQVVEVVAKSLGLRAGELFVGSEETDDTQRERYELEELLRDRSREDLRLVIRVLRALFSTPTS